MNPRAERLWFDRWGETVAESEAKERERIEREEREAVETRKAEKARRERWGV